MIQSTSGSPWDLVMGWVCLVRLIRALWGRFRAARKPGTVVWTGGWYLVGTNVGRLNVGTHLRNEVEVEVVNA